jgi:uncharacterized membrane protein (UPF0127 family)
MNHLRALLLLCTLLVSATPQAAELPTVELKIGSHRLVAEVAATTETRTTGLMYRFSLQPDHGMLFVFDAPQPLAFWMRNTYVPLSIAYIDTNGRILNIDDMAPRTDDAHPSKGVALYALEMKKGWFADRNIRAGDRVEGLDRAPRAKE